MQWRKIISLSLAGLWLPAASVCRANLTFNFIPDPGTPQSVIDGFAAAGLLWSSALQDNITINLNIGYQALPSGVIGQTTPSYVERDYATVRSALNASASTANDQAAYAHLQPGPTYTRLINHTADNPNGANSATPYTHSLTPVSVTRANAKALGLLTPDAASDAAIIFSSNTAFDFDPSNGTTAGQYDFKTLAAHEIGHVLGFVSAVDVLDQGAGLSLASQIPARVLDLFRFSAGSITAGTGVIDLTADTRNKYLSLDGGVTELTPFASGVTYGTGYQASHWREFQFAGWLMDPALFPGVQRGISATDLRAFDIMGYRVPEPGSAALLGVGLLVLAWRSRSVRGRF